MTSKPHILIIEGRFYHELSDLLLKGARDALEAAGATHEVFTVPGALEIAPAIKIAMNRKNKPFAAAVALGCILRGETYHFEVVANESARGITKLTVDESMIIGNGILTCETEGQALERADPARLNKGGAAAEAALALLDLKQKMLGHG